MHVFHLIDVESKQGQKTGKHFKFFNSLRNSN